MLPFRGDDKNEQLKVCFRILDIDHDRILNILNLLHLHKYLQPRTMLAREVITLIDEYLTKNILTNSKRLHRIELDFENFNKVLPFSCIRDEIRSKFWGIHEPVENGKLTGMEPESICQPMQGE